MEEVAEEQSAVDQRCLGPGLALDDPQLAGNG